MACMGRTSRSRRPCARGEVLCTEPGKSHPCPDRQAGPVHEGNSRTMNMHADENSDGGIVPEKRPNKEGSPSAEAVEGRTPPKGNGGETAAARTLRRDNASNGLIAVRRAARQSKSVRFTALLHHITIDLLKRSYLSLERDSAPGIDGVTWQTYGENLEQKLEDLHDRVHRGSYRARPARRTYIPKADGSKRPLSILCLEDKIVQQAVATVLEAIYEEDFRGFSYGFRPGRGQHDALDALHAGILRKQVNWVLDADIRGFFDAMAHSWIIRFLDELKERMRKFELALHPDKTRLIRFGRHAAKQREKLGEGKPETFDFLGFTHFCTRSRKWGTFVIGRKTIKKRMRAKLLAIKIELRRIMHDPIAKTGAWVKQMLKGHLNYFAVSGNHPSLWWFFNKVKRLWLASLKRRSQTARLSWERFIQCVACFFPPIRTIHPLPCHRFDARTRGRSPVR